MEKLISADETAKAINNVLADFANRIGAGMGVRMALLLGVSECFRNAERVDAVPVVRCRDCVFYHPKHVLKDGKEYSYEEMPPEAFQGLDDGFVTSQYGINVSGKCEIEKNRGYEVDKSVFREEWDYCSRGKRKGGKKQDEDLSGN